MLKICECVFETNSSSTHSLILCSDSMFKKWKDGQVIYDLETERFYNETELKEYLKELGSFDNIEHSVIDSWSLKECIKNGMEFDDFCPLTYDDCCSKKSFTTDNGEVVWSFVAEW